MLTCYTRPKRPLDELRRTSLRVSSAQSEEVMKWTIKEKETLVALNWIVMLSHKLKGQHWNDTSTSVCDMWHVTYGTKCMVENRDGLPSSSLCPTIPTRNQTVSRSSFTILQGIGQIIPVGKELGSQLKGTEGNAVWVALANWREHSFRISLYYPTHSYQLHTGEEHIKLPLQCWGIISDSWFSIVSG